MSWPLPYPQIDPVLIAIGPLAIRWYALAYIAGLVLGWQLMRRMVVAAPVVATREQVDDYLTWATLGVVLGGRIGYVLFYELFFQTERLIAAPWHVFFVWQGGMSFHGGMLGVLVATIWFCRRNTIPVLGFTDRMIIGAPIGLFFGRIANFINGELWGRPAGRDVPWAMVFPHDPTQLPRHPSQLYQALLEGVVLFALLLPLGLSERARARVGLLSGLFLIFYGLARIAGEFFREPDAPLGFLLGGATMGQLLSAPMLLGGLALIFIARKPAA